MGSKRLRLLFTPVGLVVFFGLLLFVVFGSLYMDSALGLIIWAWCVVWFSRAKGTPVPFNPPHELVTVGPYAWSRNPMLTGVFAFLFGIGFLLHSVSMVFVWTPWFIIFNVLELKLVEEPELERRFGESYIEYRRRVPMFVPQGARR
jgi:protein-S-isoprenylcysteine O-methyltransferase Ste14